MEVFNDAQLELIKRQCAPGATDDEFKMFIHFCHKSGVDPLRKQAHFIVRTWKDRTTGQARRETNMMVGIDGFRSRAEGMPDFRGIQSGAVYSSDEFSIDYGTGTVHHVAHMPRKKPLLGAWAILYRDGRKPFVQWIDADEYADERSPLHKKMQGVMLTKTAEATAYRHEYPEPFSGIYAPEELPDQGQHQQIDAPEYRQALEMPRSTAPAPEPFPPDAIAEPAKELRMYPQPPTYTYAAVQHPTQEGFPPASEKQIELIRMLLKSHLFTEKERAGIENRINDGRLDGHTCIAWLKEQASARKQAEVGPPAAEEGAGSLPFDDKGKPDDEPVTSFTLAELQDAATRANITPEQVAAYAKEHYQRDKIEDLSETQALEMFAEFRK